MSELGACTKISYWSFENGHVLVSCFWTRCTKQEISLKATFRRQQSVQQSWIIFPHPRQGWTGVSPFLPVLISLIVLHSEQDKSATLAEFSSPISHPEECEKQQPRWQLCTQLLTPLKGFHKNHWSPFTAPECLVSVLSTSHLPHTKQR